MLAGVTAVERQTLQEFRAAIPEFKADLASRSEIMTGPEFQEGATESGNQYVFAIYHIKSPYKDQVLYLASSRVWLKDKGMTVTVVFEGQGKIPASSSEDPEFEKAARAICLSVR